MSKLIQRNVLKLPQIKPIDPSKTTSPYFDTKFFCQYHRQLGHDTEKCFSLRSRIQELISNNTIPMAGVNDKGNKSISLPNQNLYIFTDPLPSHSTNVIETGHLAFSPDDVGLEPNNVVNLLDQQEPLKDLCITFDPSETIK